VIRDLRTGGARSAEVYRFFTSLTGAAEKISRLDLA